MAMERWRPFGFADRWEPFRNLSDMQGEMNRLFDTFVGRPAVGRCHGRARGCRRSTCHETKDDLVLTVEVPGVSDKDVPVSITGDLLTIKGERRWEQEREGDQDNTVLHVERVYGQFERMIQLPIAVQARQGEGHLP